MFIAVLVTVGCRYYLNMTCEIAKDYILILIEKEVMNLGKREANLEGVGREKVGMI